MRLKLSKTAWFILSIGIFLIVMGSLYVVYQGRLRAQDELKSKIAIAQAALPQFVAEREDWSGQLVQVENELTQAEGMLTQTENRLTQAKKELSQAISLLNNARVSFPQANVESIEYAELLYGLCEVADLEVTSFTSSEPQDREMEGITFSVVPFNIEVKGEVDNLLWLISRLAADVDFTTASMEVININFDEPESSEEELSASIEFAVYGYAGK